MLYQPKQTKTEIGRDVRIKKSTLGEVFDLGIEHWVVFKRQRWGLEVFLEDKSERWRQDRVALACVCSKIMIWLEAPL